jgi:uncharacterized protein YneF (UPF0154 family)
MTAIAIVLACSLGFIMGAWLAERNRIKAYKDAHRPDPSVTRLMITWPCWSCGASQHMDPIHHVTQSKQ